MVGAHRKAGGKWIKQCNFEVNCLRFISEEKEAIKHDCINSGIGLHWENGTGLLGGGNINMLHLSKS